MKVVFPLRVDMLLVVIHRNKLEKKRVFLVEQREIHDETTLRLKTWPSFPGFPGGYGLFVADHIHSMQYKTIRYFES